MSGLGDFSTGGNATMLRIGMGKDEKDRDRAVIGRRAKAGDPGAVTYMFGDETVKDKDTGEPLYRTEHSFIEGVVRKIERAQPEYNGKKVEVLNLHFDTGSGTYSLELKKGNDYWVDFALRCADIDWSKSVRLTPYSIPQEDNPKFSNRLLVPSQGGTKIKRKWMLKWHKEDGVTAPEPAAGEPPAYTYDFEEAEWKKRKVWNWLDQNPIQEAIDKVTFFNNGIVEDMEPGAEPATALDAASNTAAERAKASAVDMPPVVGDEDDLPF